MRFLKKRTVAKSALYYISEIVIVVIGIFVAIQLNNLNEDRKINKDAEQSLKRLYNDLRTEKFMLTQVKSGFKNSSDFLKAVVYENKTDQLDSLSYHLGLVFVHYKLNSEYISLKFGGKLNLISNDTLRYNLVNYYETAYTVFEEYAENHKHTFNENIAPYFQAHFPSDTTYLFDPILVKPRLKDQKFINLMIDQISAFKIIGQSLSIDRVDGLMQMVSNEIKK